MSESNVERARRVVEDFNRDAADLDSAPEPAWAREPWVDPDVEIVPLRAALEGTVYRPPVAAQQFWDDCRTSWRTLRLEIRDIRREGSDHVLGLSTLHGTARETGLEVATKLVSLTTFRDGRVVRFAVYDAEAKALQAIREGD